MSVRRDIPISMQATYAKATTGKSRTFGVRAFCQECCGYDRYQVSLCTDTGCPLHAYRPYRSAAAVKKARKATDGTPDEVKERH